MQEILVSISCTTYNHAPYVQECLEGFLMQKTDFQFEVLVHDDASTDGTIAIIREYEKKYPHIIKPIIQEENQYSQGKRGFNAKYNYSRAKGKYIALCEGDDYWTDPLKLQKQVEFLEGNPDFSGIGTNYANCDIKGNIIKVRHDYSKRIDQLSNTHNIYILKGIPKTLTAMYRNIPEAFELMSRISNRKIYNGDELLCAIMRNWGSIGFIDEVTGVYRLHDKGVYSSKSRFEKTSMSLKSFREIKNLLESNGFNSHMDSKISSYHIRVFSYYLVKFKIRKAINYFRDFKDEIKISIVNGVLICLKEIWVTIKTKRTLLKH